MPVGIARDALNLEGGNDNSLSYKILFWHFYSFLEVLYFEVLEFFHRDNFLQKYNFFPKYSVFVKIFSNLHPIILAFSIFLLSLQLIIYY